MLGWDANVLETLAMIMMIAIKINVLVKRILDTVMMYTHFYNYLYTLRTEDDFEVLFVPLNKNA